MISFTSPGRTDPGVLYVEEGDAAQIVVTRTDTSAAQGFRIRHHYVNQDQAALFPDVDINDGVLVFFAPGVAEQTVTLQTREDRIASGHDTGVGFMIVPGEGTTQADFNLFGEPAADQNWAFGAFSVVIAEDDAPTFSLTIAGHGKDDSAVWAREGSTTALTFNRTDATFAAALELRPGDAESAAYARDYFGYDPAAPLVVRWAAGDASAKTLSLTASEDSGITEPGSWLNWSVVPIEGTASGFAESPLRNGTPTPDGGLHFPVAFLDNDAIPAHRFYNTETFTHFYTTSAYERDSILANLPNFRYEGEGFKTLPGTVAGGDEVYRFYNTLTNTHFFTASEFERDSVMANLPNFTFEGTGFHAATSDAPGMTEVYRFYSALTGTHFYTASAEERQNVINTLPHLQDEGVAFYVPASSDALIA